jgi:protein arginine kinase
LPSLGYLTACPTNVGTGIRASVMMHLPALVLAKQIEQVIQAILKLGLAVRGLYGEGTEASGNIFQISNQVTLGKSEEEILNNLDGVIRQIVGHERNARDLLLKTKLKQVEDRVCRAYGLLTNVRTISSKETVDLLSALRMGVDLGLLKEVERVTINELFMITQPAHLQKLSGKKLGPTERDIIRADLVRERLLKK